ncbi:MAG: polysaccharide biosynthesis tyrosine autokinase [Anaerolineae bacterium]|nr:polysaccharide biosynthesis tyrosine autokinase [Anaerolineae bacterium]
MELGEILDIIWKRLWLVVAGTVVVAVLVFVASRNMKSIYEARVLMMVNPSQNAPLNQTSIATGEDLAMTYSELLKARPLLEIVIANLSLDLAPDDVADMLGTELIPGTQLLELTVQYTNAQQASDIANEIVFTFVSSHNTEQQLQSIVALERDVVSQMTILKELLEKTQSDLQKARMSSGLLTEDEANLIETNLTNQQLTYVSLLETFLNIRLVQAQLLDVTVIEPAITPTTPIRPNIPIYTFLGAFAGFVFGVGLTFLVEYLDDSFETGDDVERALSLPALGTIPKLRHPEYAAMRRHRKRASNKPGAIGVSGLVTSVAPRSFVSEAYRVLRTNIRFVAGDQSLKTLLVAAVEPKTGGTTVVAELGVLCARAGLQVVLVDTDLYSPKLHHLLGVDLASQQKLALEDTVACSGLTDLLSGDVRDVYGAMLSTPVDNLYLITSGSASDNPSERLNSKQMELVLAEIARNADLVILDAPPVLAVTDAAVLATKVDGVILTVEAKRTSQQAALEACEIIQRVGATVLGVVLTKVKMKRRGLVYNAYLADVRRTRRQTTRRMPGDDTSPQTNLDQKPSLRTIFRMDTLRTIRRKWKRLSWFGKVRRS